jgi:hypothetical protein
MKDKSDKNLPSPTDEVDRKLLADVQGHGWHVIWVETDEEGPGFAYSIGLHYTFGHPEVIVFGLSGVTMHRMINEIGERIRAGSRFDNRDESADVLDGCNVIFRNVERKHYPEYLGYAIWFHQGDRFPALQCVWPDSQHRYPWHPHFDRKFLVCQPVLSDEAM